MGIHGKPEAYEGANVLKSFLKETSYNQRTDGKGRGHGGQGWTEDEERYRRENQDWSRGLSGQIGQLNACKGKCKGGGQGGESKPDDEEMAGNMAQLLQSAFMKGAEWGKSQVASWMVDNGKMGGPKGGKGDDGFGKGKGDGGLGKGPGDDGWGKGGDDGWGKGCGKDGWGGDGFGKGGGGAAAPGGVIGTFQGTIRSFNDDKGFGFIVSADVTNAGYKDTFLHRRAKGNWSVGQVVKFTAYLNDKGMPQAKDLEPGIRPDGTLEVEGEPVEKKSMDDAGQEIGDFVGTIKTFNHEKGYGFIECKELTDAGYKDAFVHKNQRNGFDAGSKVKFTAFTTSEGKVQGKNLTDGAAEAQAQAVIDDAMAGLAEAWETGS